MPQRLLAIGGTLHLGMYLSQHEQTAISRWSDIRMAMRYTHATGDGIRRAMQLLTQAEAGGEEKR